MKFRNNIQRQEVFITRETEKKGKNEQLIKIGEK